MGETDLADYEAQFHAWMLGAQGGDGVATQCLLTGLAPRLRSFFRAKGSDPDAAEDLVQETLIAIYTKRGLFDPSQRLLSWAYAIARYRMIDRWRSNKRRGQELPIEDFEHVLEAQDHQAGDPVRDVARLLATLPPKQRTAIELVKLKDMSIAQAAQASGLSPSDIKISIHRGLKTLMARMKADPNAPAPQLPPLSNNRSEPHHDHR